MTNKYNSKEKLDQKVNETDPTLSNRTYEPNKTFNWKLTTKTFRTEKGFRAFNLFPYLMTQIPGGVVYGECKPPSGEIEMDSTKEGYDDTLYHEDRHVAGDCEYLAEFHTANRNYHLTA